MVVKLKINYDEESLNNTSSRNRKKKGIRRNINYNEYDAYFLYEDIISFIQFNLLINTQTKTVDKIEDFNFIFQKNNEYQNFKNINKLNESDIKRFKISKQNNDFYAYYKKTKANIKEEKKEEKKKDKQKVVSNKNLIDELFKKHPKYALMNEIREKEIENFSKRNSTKTRRRAKSILSSSSSLNLNNYENDADDFFSDVKVTNLNDNIEKKKEKEKQEKIEKMKQKTINIEKLVRKHEEPEDIMKELEEEQKKWEAKVNSSASSFSVTSSISSNTNQEYRINLYNYMNLDKKQQKHFIIEKKLETKIDDTKMLLKDRDLVSTQRKEELLKEREIFGDIYANLNKEDKSMSESSYLSFLSKNQKYPY